jgi:hypothetical protein
MRTCTPGNANAFSLNTVPRIRKLGISLFFVLLEELPSVAALCPLVPEELEFVAGAAGAGSCALIGRDKPKTAASKTEVEVFIPVFALKDFPQGLMVQCLPQDAPRFPRRKLLVFIILIVFIFVQEVAVFVKIFLVLFFLLEVLVIVFLEFVGDRVQRNWMGL